MIIDCNATLGNWPFRRLRHSTPEDFVRLMDDYGITQAWAGSFEGIFYRDAGEANRILASAVSAHADRLRPWAAINPAFPAWEDDLKEAVELGFLGLRLYPNYHGYTLSDTCADELFSAALHAKLPVTVYHKVQDERLHHPQMVVLPTDMTLLPLVQRYPELPVICCGLSAHLLTAELCSAVAGGSVYLDISRWEGIGGVELLVKKVGARQVLFVSHSPEVVELADARIQLGAAEGAIDE